MNSILKVYFHKACYEVNDREWKPWICLFFLGY